MTEKREKNGGLHGIRWREEGIEVDRETGREEKEEVEIDTGSAGEKRKYRWTEKQVEKRKKK